VRQWQLTTWITRINSDNGAEVDEDDFLDNESVSASRENKFLSAVRDLQIKLNEKNLQPQIRGRIQSIKQFLNFLLSGRGVMEASSLVSESIGAGVNTARLIQKWTNDYIKTRTIPISKRGQHQKVKSLLGDEDVKMKIMEYLRSSKYEVTPKRLKEFVETDVFPSLGIESKKTITEKTANAWLRHCGWVL